MCLFSPRTSPFKTYSGPYVDLPFYFRKVCVRFRGHMFISTKRTLCTSKYMCTHVKDFSGMD